MSFNFMGYYRVGSYRVLRSFLLNQLRSARQRIRTIDAELTRIGAITVLYKTVPADNGSSRGTEERVGLAVTPDSSVCRLVQAYIAQGGNPFDISMFLDPNSSSWREVPDSEDSGLVEHQTQPYGGVLFPMSRQESDYRSGGLGSLDTGGMLMSLKNPKRRMGSTPVENRPNYGATRRSQYIVRKPFRQAIRDKRNNLEWRILKLMDLREQLEHEKSEILMACGGYISGVAISEGTVDMRLSTFELLGDLDNEIFSYDEEGNCLGPDRARLREGIRSYIYEDFVQEKWTGL